MGRNAVKRPAATRPDRDPFRRDCDRDTLRAPTSRARAATPRGSIAIMESAMSDIALDTPFLGSRNTGRRLWLTISAALKDQAVRRALIDFSGISGISHGFADELLSPLSERLGKSLANRVSFVNCANAVERTFGVVADMHGLQLPKFDRRSEGLSARVSVEG
jgi:hypothetical protein